MLQQLSLSNSTTRLTALMLLVTALVGTVWMKRRRPKLNLKARVSKLIIYPIKSAPGIEVDHLEVENATLKYKNIFDRQWLLVNSKGHFLRLVDAPKLVTLKVSYVDNGILLKAPGMPDFKLNLIDEIPKDQLVYSVSIWKETIDGLYAGDEASKWFSKAIQIPEVKLLQFHPKLKQSRKGEFVVNQKMIHSEKNPIRYQDSASCMLLNEASCLDCAERINEKCKKEGKPSINVTYQRFRPNILASGFEPYEEDRWTHVQINSCLFEVRLACGRCRMTTLDYDKVEFSDEPLKTLREYRMGTPGINSPNTPVMGTYIQNVNSGTIRVNDPVYVDN